MENKEAISELLSHSQSIELGLEMQNIFNPQKRSAAWANIAKCKEFADITNNKSLQELIEIRNNGFLLQIVITRGFKDDVWFEVYFNSPLLAKVSNISSGDIFFKQWRSFLNSKTIEQWFKSNCAMLDNMLFKWTKANLLHYYFTLQEGTFKNYWLNLRPSKANQLIHDLALLS